MAGNLHSLRNGIIYILLGGVIMFVAIFLGIQAGFAIKSEGSTELTPENLPNRSLVKPGDAIPPLPVYSANGEQFMLEAITGGRPTLVGLVLPGCEPCKLLLQGWGEKGIINGNKNYQVILLVSSGDDSRELGPLADFADKYDVYFCDHVPLKEHLGITTFPTVMGLGKDHSISFVANAYVHKLENEFFEQYL
jgi:hypothetical protein